MPRVRFRRSPQRRTNWLARHESWQVIGSAVSLVDFILWDSTNTSDPITKMTNPTLIRLRGSLLLDPDFGFGIPATNSFQCQWMGYIYVSPLAHGEFTEAKSSRDDILWSFSYGFHGRYERQQHTAVGIENAFHVNDVRPIEINVKAARRLGDEGKVRMLIAAVSVGEATTSRYSYFIRGLFKE